jgi:hypothetical protein
MIRPSRMRNLASSIYPAYVYYGIVEITLTGLVVWYAWIWSIQGALLV